MTLRDLSIGQTATIIEVGGSGALRQHFLDMGVIPGEEISLVKFAPMGDPMELRVRGYELTLRLDDAEKIIVENVRASQSLENQPRKQSHKEAEHPGYGEEEDTKSYHKEHDKAKIVKGKLTFALVGNQNCGKTTLFNELTGSNQHVGNFPGVTVDRKSGAIKGYPDTEVVDLPGIYSLSPYTSEEIVSRIINKVEVP